MPRLERAARDELSERTNLTPGARTLDGGNERVDIVRDILGDVTSDAQTSHDLADILDFY